MRLASGLAFAAEETGAYMRMIVKDGKAELTCRKERKSKIQAFISSREEMLFKGRLQIRKSKNGFSILVKGYSRCTGILSEVFRTLVA